MKLVIELVIREVLNNFHSKSQFMAKIYKKIIDYLKQISNENKRRAENVQNLKSKLFKIIVKSNLSYL